MFLLIEFCCGTPPSCLKVMGWVVVGGGGLQDFSVSPRPLGFWVWVLGVWGLGLTKFGPSLPPKNTDRNSVPTCFYLHRIGDLNLVLPALKLSTLDDGILIMVQQVIMMMLSLNMVEYSMSFLSLSA